MKLTETSPGSFIFTADNVFTQEECKAMIDLFEKDTNKHPGIMGDGKVHLDIKRSVDLEIRPKFPHWKPHDDLICKKTLQMMEGLSEYLFALKGASVKDTGYNIQRYTVGHEFKWHADATSIKNCDRMFAVIYYLNDVEEGGTTDFHYQKVSIVPKPGRMVVFPAGFTHVHRGDVVTKGVKYIITTFIVYAP